MQRCKTFKAYLFHCLLNMPIFKKIFKKSKNENFTTGKKLQ